MRTLLNFTILATEELVYCFVLYVLLFRFEPSISGEPHTNSNSQPPSPRILIELLQSSTAPPYISWITFIGVCVVFGLGQISFFRAAFPSAQGIPSSFSLQTNDIPIRYSFIERDNKGDIRKCKKCFKIKPDRSHHCSRCNECILKMDHHCPFLANCVGFSNYKFFVLFLFYTVLFGSIMVAAGGYHIYDRISKADGSSISDNLDYYIVVAAAFAVIALLLLLPFTLTHFRLVVRNLTTIEHLEKRSRSSNPFDLGWKRNFTEVFGSNPFLWLVPVWSSKGDGITFPSLTLSEKSSLLLHT